MVFNDSVLILSYMLLWQLLITKVSQHGHPYVSAVVHNGTQTYDHDSDG